MKEKENRITCKDCENFDMFFVKKDNKPCIYRDYPDFKNICYRFKRRMFDIVTRG